MIGVLPLGDISSALGGYEEKASSMLVGKVMTTDVLTCSPNDELADVRVRMAGRSIRHMPLIENGRLSGLIARRDALEFLCQQESLEVDHLSDGLFRADARCCYRRRRRCPASRR